MKLTIAAATGGTGRRLLHTAPRPAAAAAGNFCPTAGAVGPWITARSPRGRTRRRLPLLGMPPPFPLPIVLTVSRVRASLSR